MDSKLPNGKKLIVNHFYIYKKMMEKCNWGLEKD
jgi:hypothetical protein